MKIASQIPALLLALVFIVFGLNFFMQFIPIPAMTGLPQEFFGVMAVKSNYMLVVKVMEIAFGLLLLLPKTRALGLVLIAPICVNILMYEVLIEHRPGIGVALVILCLMGMMLNREKYKSILS
jgi:putative oxidoreductase